MDPRIEEAQRLFWEIETFARAGVPHRALVTRMRDAARLHAEVATSRLDAGDLRGWIDLFAAITWWGQAGEKREAQRALEEGQTRASALQAGAEEILRELDELRRWLAKHPVVPSLADFAVTLPPPPDRAAA